MTRALKIHSAAAFLFGLAILATPTRAMALDWGLKLEPGMAAAAGQPQSRMFGPGFGGSLKGLIGVGRYLDAQAGITYIGLTAQPSAPSSGVGGAWGYGAGLRFKRPHDLVRGYSPWVDADLMYVRTGDLNRFGFSFGAGVSASLDEDRRFWLGPFVRYLQIVQGERIGADNTDASIFIVGASLEFGSPHRRAAAKPVECSPCSPCSPCSSTAEAVTDRDGDGVVDGVDKCPDQPGPRATSGCPDRDDDGLADVADMCPDARGPIDNKGCPVYQKVIIKPNKLELKEKILFSWDKAAIEPQSYPLLDEVVQALKDNKSFHVRIEGHTDSSGKETHNQTLSEARARAVLDYVAKHGIAMERLASKGFSSSQPIDRNDTTAGREANRRVEFAVDLVIVNDGSVK
ncbi:MAG: OmpA-like Outer rane domain protein [Myxococcales bacterium]|nr:OmpA-like Outer rane domain protein [Myxococcales bacterium]